MKLTFTSLLLLCYIGTITSQAPSVTTATPVAQSLTSEPSTAISVTFDQAMDVATINSDSFLVFGRWSGPMDGTVTLSGDGLTASFTPTRDLFYGEWVSVRLTSGITNTNGVFLENGFGYNYWTKTLPGVLDQTFLSQISAEADGETFIQCYGAYAGDVNDDEFSDLVVVTENAQDARLFLNDGAGNYGEFTIFDMPDANKPSPSEGADFNHDGKIDVAVSSVQSNNVTVFMGDEADIFDPAVSFETDTGARGLTVIDANGDGWDDLVTANRNASNFSILINDGTGSFNTAVTSDAGVDNETSIIAVDLNGDGFTDLAIGGLSSNNIRTLLNDGEGNFSQNDLTSVSGSPWMLGTGDMNLDGNADVVSVNTNGQVAVLVGDGAGNLTLSGEYPVGSFSLAIDVGDIDGDGDLDFISSSFSGVNYTLYENDGTGNFINPLNYDAVSAGSCAILHDRDNDGDMDITLIDEIEDVIILYRNGEPLSVNDVLVPEITISPNPFTDRISIEGISEFPAKVVLYDIHGRLIYSEIITNQTELDLSKVGLVSGLYLIELHQGNHITTSKIIKQ